MNHIVVIRITTIWSVIINGGDKMSKSTGGGGMIVGGGKIENKLLPWTC